MGNKTFKDLTQIECAEAYKRMESNSDRRWKSAELLASNEDFGGAIRDHITSVEELIKAIIIYLDAQGFEFRKVDGMDIMLTRSHSLRHFMAFIMFILNVFAEDIKGFFIKSKEDPTLFKIIGKGSKGNKMKMQKFMRVYIFKKVLKIKAEYKWFEKVELLRQAGTHVDYKETLISPEDISLRDYKQVFMRLENVRKMGKEVLLTFDTKNTYLEKEVEKLKQDLHNKGWYRNMGEALKNVKNKKPFELFSNEVKELDIGTNEELKEHLRDKSLFKGIKHRGFTKKKKKE